MTAPIRDASLPVELPRIGSVMRKYMHLRNIDLAALTADLRRNVVVSESTVQRWLDNGPVTAGLHLRSIIAALALPRSDVHGHVAPIALLPALWSRALGAEVRRSRLELGLGTADVAVSAGVSEATIIRLERASTTPRCDLLARVLRALNLSASGLLPLGEWPPDSLPIGDRPAFASLLRRVRSETNRSQRLMAELFGVRQATLQAWECGRTYPSRDLWPAIAAGITELGTDVSVEQLRQLQLPEMFAADELAALNPIGRLLTEARMAKRMSVEIAAEHCGVTRHTFMMWIQGECLPHATALGKIVIALGVDRDAAAEALQSLRFGNRRDLGTWCYAQRSLAGVEPKKLAATIGTHRNRISEWETGRAAVPARFVDLIVHALGIDRIHVEHLPLAPDTGRAAHGAQLRQVRLAAGLSQTALAAVVGSSQALVSAYEQGVLIPLPMVAAKLNAMFPELVREAA